MTSANRELIAAVTGGFVTDAQPGAGLALVGHDGRVVRTLAPVGAQLVAAQRTRIAWADDECTSGCAVHVVDLVRHTDAVVTRVDASLGRDAGAFSPDGTRFAVRGNDDKVVLVDLARGRARSTPAASSTAATRSRSPPTARSSRPPGRR